MIRPTLIVGGAASGKSTYALERATACGANVLFVATCVPRDDEMRLKVARHREERPGSWTTVERERDLVGALTPGFDAAIVDCLTLFVSQMLVEGVSDSVIFDEISSLSAPSSYPIFLVTNEVGLGIVPEYPLARRFRELAGRCNRIVARAAHEVILMTAGIPMPIKKENA